MTDRHRRYLAGEAAIGAAISAALSLAFTLALFGGMARVPVAGVGGLIVDAIPQSFMVALMSALVPTLLTRHRVRRGRVASRDGQGRGLLPRHALVRAVLFAAAAAAAGVALAAALLGSGPASWPFETVVIAKMLYGALLGGSVAALATHAALADGAA